MWHREFGCRGDWVYTLDIDGGRALHGRLPSYESSLSNLTNFGIKWHILNQNASMGGTPVADVPPINPNRDAASYVQVDVFLEIRVGVLDEYTSSRITGRKFSKFGSLDNLDVIEFEFGLFENRLSSRNVNAMLGNPFAQERHEK
jgi:hypothetical protein